MLTRQSSVFRVLLFSGFAIFISILWGCTGLFSTVFGQDDPRLFVAVAPLYTLPFSETGPHFLLVQGVGGRFSHTGSDAWAFDFAMPTGTRVRAARDGIVASIRAEKNDRSIPLEKRPANYVRIRHDDGSVAVYAHLDKIDTTWLRPGTSIRRGDVIGLSGNTGFSTQPHLHFHVEKLEPDHPEGVTIPIAFEGVSDPFGIPRVGRFYPE